MTQLCLTAAAQLLNSLNGFCNRYATCLSDTWCDLLSSLTYSENMPSIHPIPEKEKNIFHYVFAFLLLHLPSCQLLSFDLEAINVTITLISYHCISLII